MWSPWWLHPKGRSGFRQQLQGEKVVVSWISSWLFPLYVPSHSHNKRSPTPVFHQELRFGLSLQMQGLEVQEELD